jgi:altronate hydrolase
MKSQGLAEGPLLATMNIQDIGGTSAIVDWGEKKILEMLPAANAVRREPVDASHLVVGLQCGGSDGFSGVTANPALGAAVDLLVAHGGTGVLSESPELFGAQHLLTRRAVSREVGDRVVACIDWWQAYFAKHVGKVINTAPGNFEGGLTTSPEKSLGSFAKGGTTNLTGFFGYAEPITAKGFVFMDTPSYDPVSVTGQIAGGANLVCFTTGRGSAFGSVPAPCVKLATNTPLFRKQADDIDVNCGDILEGTASLDDVGARIFERMLAVASGEKTKSESFGYGEPEFSPWLIEPTL